jgi:hypothetical protein
VGKITGFMEFQRQEEDHLEPAARLKNYKEFTLTLTDAKRRCKARAAWIAASRSATPAARSTT